MGDDRRGDVIAAVNEELSRRQWHGTDLAAAAGISPDTAQDFLAGSRWPRRTTLAKIERAFDWEPGVIADMVAGRVDVVPVDNDSDKMLFHMPPGTFDGLDAVDREEALQAAKLAAMRTAREIRERK